MYSDHIVEAAVEEIGRIIVQGGDPDALTKVVKAVYDIGFNYGERQGKETVGEWHRPAGK